MLETECYKELNLFGVDGGPSPDLMEDQPPPPPRRGFFDRVFKRQQVGTATTTSLHALLSGVVFPMYHAAVGVGQRSPRPRLLNSAAAVPVSEPVVGPQSEGCSLADLLPHPLPTLPAYTFVSLGTTTMDAPVQRLFTFGCCVCCLLLESTEQATGACSLHCGLVAMETIHITISSSSSSNSIKLLSQVRQLNVGGITHAFCLHGSWCFCWVVFFWGRGGGNVDWGEHVLHCQTVQETIDWFAMNPSILSGAEDVMTDLLPREH